MQTPSSLLWTLEEIGHLVSGSGNPAETLTNIVHLIQQRFRTDVCSVYLLEPDRLTVGDPAPDVALFTPDCEPVSLGSLWKERHAVLIFGSYT